MKSSRTAWMVFILCGLVLLCSSDSFAVSIEEDFSLEIKNGSITTQLKSVSVIKKNGYDQIKVAGLDNFAQTGQPLLPVKTVKYLIPFGKKVTNISIGWTKKKLLYGTYLVEPAQTQIPLSYTGEITPTLPD